MMTGILTTDFSLRYSSDIDECSSNSKACHEKASCSNTIGSYKCVCNHGYGGDGLTFCLRKLISLFSSRWSRQMPHDQCSLYHSLSSFLFILHPLLVRYWMKFCKCAESVLQLEQVIYISPLGYLFLDFMMHN